MAWGCLELLLTLAALSVAAEILDAHRSQCKNVAKPPAEQPDTTTSVALFIPRSFLNGHRVRVCGWMNEWDREFATQRHATQHDTTTAGKEGFRPA